jgi:hypothetical protein
MSDQWYYAWRKERLGPYSGRQLQELAEDGKIQPPDTVWQEGVEHGVVAARVRNLFPLAREANDPAAKSIEMAANTAVSLLPAILAQSEIAPTVEGWGLSEHHPLTVDAERKVESTPEESAAGEDLTSRAPAAPQPNLAPKQAKPKKGHAIAIRGAVVVSHDGMRVQYRKKCPKCKNEDVSKNSMPTRNGVTRVTFFCRKCRKLMSVEILGTGK